MPEQKTVRARKAAAITAGGALVVGGIGFTLAAWTDSEWVNAGGGLPGVGTSTFEVQQSITAPYTADETFADFETAPGRGLAFTPGALALTPGEAVYAPVALRTTADSVAGDVVLQAAVPAPGVTTDDPDEALWGALAVRVATTTDLTAECSAVTFAAPTATVVADGALAAAGGSGAQALAAESGSTQLYCFEVTLPTAVGTDGETLQGRTVAPAWEFAATSVSGTAAGGSGTVD